MARRPLLLTLGLQEGPADDRLGAFTTFLLLSEAAQTALWAWLPKPGEAPPGGTTPGLVAVFAIGAAILGLFGKWSRHAVVVATLVTVARIVIYFPGAPNHTYLAVWCLGILGLCGMKAEEDNVLALNALGWLTLIVLFASGFQKVAHGLYFRGQYLAFQHHVAHRIAGAEMFFGHQEQAIYDGIGALHLGAGPFGATTATGLLVSNLVWIVELLAPFGLFFRQSRARVLAGVLVAFAAIAGGSRELMFGMLFMHLLCLFAQRDRNTAFLPLCTAVFGLMIATRLGWIPYWTFN